MTSMSRNLEKEEQILKSYHSKTQLHDTWMRNAVSKLNDRLENKTVILSTAHPAKFPNALEKAGINLTTIPKNLEKFLDKKEISFKLSPFDNSIFEFIKDNN